MKKVFKTALFDMDGVLFDSMPGHVIAYRDALQPHGINMPAEVVYACEGMKGVDTIQQYGSKMLGRQLSLEESEMMYEEKCRIFRSLPPAEKIPGVEHLMKLMKDAGMNVCVVTGSGQISLLEKLPLKFPGLLTKDRIVCCHDYQHGKPAADPYLVGMQRCGTQPSETVVIENAPLGVRAGKAAGCFTIAVNTGPLDEQVFIEAGADVIFKSMAEAEAFLM